MAIPIYGSVLEHNIHCISFPRSFSPVHELQKALKILGVPFSRPTALPSATSSTRLAGAVSSSPQVLFHHTIPASVRSGNNLTRTADDPDAYYTAELGTALLDEIKSYLWLAGLPSSGRPLHRQQLLGRTITITEDPNEHFVWHETRIFIKPLPIFLFDLDCWSQKICKNRRLHEAACGFLLSYAWLVSYESDLRIAHEIGLLPEFVHWDMWTEFKSDLLKFVDLHSLSGVSPRYQYGELRLSRLNKIYSTTRFTWKTLIRGYMTTSTWYQDFFTRNFTWLLAVFAIVSVILSGMQVILSSTRSTETLSIVSYGFTILSLFLSAGIISGLLLLELVFFIYHVGSSHKYHRNFIRERKSAIGP
ncbi:uncharacterized protein RSE6_00874 [Rhynchosporium secalis]|uniref:Uncharacterized protein n=1 Tax=Rhynchosporium secalis TaxID=38038 RepID=A0A1E1LWB2_RHYSE|nr:uncharacterized protein RSE6_00874 [Rhynchosporium secalis]